MTADVRIEIGGAALARPLLDPICELYDEVFSVPPFFWRADESALHRERLLGLLDDPGFGVAVARAGDELVGFAYGFTVPPDTKRWSGLLVPVSAEVASEWPGRTFFVVRLRCAADVPRPGHWPAPARRSARKPA